MFVCVCVCVYVCMCVLVCVLVCVRVRMVGVAGGCGWQSNSEHP